MIQKKVCLLGAFAVGKTSLVTRFVSGIYSRAYQTTVGVRLDRRDVVAHGRPVRLILWDLHGEDQFQSVEASYLRGSSGCVLVVDPTRPQTLAVAAELEDRARRAAGDVPFEVLFNKADLLERWDLGQVEQTLCDARRWRVWRTSALSGVGVAEAFEALAARMMERSP